MKTVCVIRDPYDCMIYAIVPDRRSAWNWCQEHFVSQGAFPSSISYSNFQKEMEIDGMIEVYADQESPENVPNLFIEEHGLYPEIKDAKLTRIK